MSVVVLCSSLKGGPVTVMKFKDLLGPIPIIQWAGTVMGCRLEAKGVTEF